MRCGQAQQSVHQGGGLRLCSRKNRKRGIQRWELIEVLTFWWDCVKWVPADSQSAVRYCIQPDSRSKALTPASHHSALFVSSFPPFFHSTQTPPHTHRQRERELGTAANTHPDANIHASTNIFLFVPAR